MARQVVETDSSCFYVASQESRHVSRYGRILLVEYHLRRNAIARASQEKMWRMKHKKVKFPLL